jgi:hypothetical protein
MKNLAASFSVTTQQGSTSEENKAKATSDFSVAPCPLIVCAAPAAAAAVAAREEDPREVIHGERVAFIRSLGCEAHPHEWTYIPSTIELAQRLGVTSVQIGRDREKCRTLNIKLMEVGLLRDGYCPSWFSDPYECPECGKVPNRGEYVEAKFCPWCERRSQTNEGIPEPHNGTGNCRQPEKDYGSRY